MNYKPTPETDAAEHRGAVIWPDFARRLELERDEARSALEFQRNLFKLQEEQPQAIIKAMREALEAADECLALIEDVGHGAHMDNVTVARGLVLRALDSENAPV